MRVSNTSERLKKIMEETGKRQTDLLKLLQPYCQKYNEKINKSHLSQWISGSNEPNQRKLVVLAEALNVSEAWLMGYDVPMHKEDIKKTAQADAELFLSYKKLNEENKTQVKNYINFLLSQQE